MKYRLEEVCQVNSENLKKSDEYEFINYLDTANITEGKIDEVKKLIIGEDKIPSRAKRKVKKDDIVISTVRPNLKHYGIIKNPLKNMIVSTGFAVLSPNKEIVDPDYLYFYLTQQKITDYLSAIAETSTSAYPSITMNVIKNLEVDVPSRAEQSKIARILSVMDEKIELNYKINKNLEEIAQAIFKHWFVDFEFPNENGEPYKSSGGKFVESELGMIPREWEVVELDSILDMVKENTKSGEHLKGLPYVPIDAIPMKKIGLDKFKYWTEAKSSLITFDKNDILLGAMRVYFHRVAIAPEKGVTRTTTFVLRPKIESDLSYALLLIFQESTISYANSSSKGTTIPYAVWENGLNEMKIALPPIELRKKFHNSTWPMLRRIRDSIYEQLTLSKIRDTLLPKLMSGEIRIPEAEQEVEACLQKTN